MKMEHIADSLVTAVSQGHNKVWTDEELALVEEMAGQRCTKEMIRRAFPGRTYAAVKLKLHSIRKAYYSRTPRNEPKGTGDRRDFGVNPLHPDEPGVDDGWEILHLKNMKEGNKAFLAALPRAYA